MGHLKDIHSISRVRFKSDLDMSRFFSLESMKLVSLGVLSRFPSLLSGSLALLLFLLPPSFALDFSSHLRSSRKSLFPLPVAAGNKRTCVQACASERQPPVLVFVLAFYFAWSGRVSLLFWPYTGCPACWPITCYPGFFSLLFPILPWKH